MTTEEMKSILDKNPQYRNSLYVRGFCITSDTFNIEEYPFYGNWKYYPTNSNIKIYADIRKPVHTISVHNRTFFLIGHAYDPFDNLSSEVNILNKLIRFGNMWEATSDLTGVYCVGYIENDVIVFTSDAAGQQMIYYGAINGNSYVTSHSHLVADICNLNQDPYVVKLINYKFYHLFGTVLPGDLSPYTELKRAQCNFYTTVSLDTTHCNRFWPTKTVVECKSKGEYQKAIQEIADILHKNMTLIAQKWPKRSAAISVTGGMDSKTTLACTKGLYSQFSYFSYDSLPDERVDADAAHQLCHVLGLEHKIYTIPLQSTAYSPLDVWREIFSFNSGSIGYNNENDIKKRLYFAKIHDFDIEVKSWVDEIGRARYHKRFAKKRFPTKPTPRYLTSLYKAFLHNRKLVQQTDAVFHNYLEAYYSDEVFDQIPWWDLFYWEFEWNAAEALFLTGEHLFAYDITIPFNNRKLLELMLTVPLKKRITDDIQRDVIALMNNKIIESGIHVNDISHTQKRAFIERAYLEVNTRLPF